MYNKLIKKLDENNISTYISLYKEIEYLYKDEEWIDNLDYEEVENICDLKDHINMVLAKKLISLYES